MSKNGNSTRGFKVAAIQFDVRRGEAEANLQSVEQGLRSAAEAGVRLAVLPELWTVSYVEDYDDAVLAASAAAEDRLADLSRELGMLVVGSAPAADGGQLYNRARVLDRGETLGEYRKLHLFTPIHEEKLFTPGTEPLVLDTELGRIGVLLCYDLRFPELTRWYFDQEVELLLVPAQWPEARASHWRTLLQARAIENECFVVGCNRSGVEPSLRSGESLIFPGDSRIVDPMGELLATAAGEEAPLIAEVELRKVRMMNRILPVRRDRRPELYERLQDLQLPPARSGDDDEE